MTFPRLRNGASGFALAAVFGMALTQGAAAQTLEERVKALEAAQQTQSDAALALSELIKRVEVSGFVSVRGGRIDSDDVLFLNLYDDEWSFSDDSLVGLQVDTRVSDKLSVSLQMKAMGFDDSVQLEWGYLEYAFQPDLKLRAGRLRMPGFMLSEYVDVGYAYPWAQVPYEVYGWLPFNRYEGMDLRYWVSFGDVDVRFNPYMGTTSDAAMKIGKLTFTEQSSQVAGLDVQVNYDILTVRAGYSKYRFELHDAVLDRYLTPLVHGTTLVPGVGPYIDEVRIPGLVDYVQDVLVGGVLTDALLAATDPMQQLLLQGEMASLLAQVEPFKNIAPMNGKHDGEYFGLGFNIDNGQFQIMSELSHAEISGAYPDLESGYIMMGYRFGRWMPHFTFAKMYTINDDERPSLQLIEANPILAANPDYAQAVAGANRYTGALVATMNIVRLEQESYTLGVRWDPTPGFAVKAEVFRVEPKNGSYGFAIPSSMMTMTNTDLSALADQELDFSQQPEHITGLRIALDVVF